MYKSYGMTDNVDGVLSATPKPKLKVSFQIDTGEEYGKLRSFPIVDDIEAGLIKEESYDETDQFGEGISKITELAENGVIGEEEEFRRKKLLMQFLEYQQGDDRPSPDGKSLLLIIVEFLRKLFSYCMKFAIYTDAVDDT
jgi:hypothetical protein